jgi:hypothetical protein
MAEAAVVTATTTDSKDEKKKKKSTHGNNNNNKDTKEKKKTVKKPKKEKAATAVNVGTSAITEPVLTAITPTTATTAAVVTAVAASEVMELISDTAHSESTKKSKPKKSKLSQGDDKNTTTTTTTTPVRPKSDPTLTSKKSKTTQTKEISDAISSNKAATAVTVDETKKTSELPEPKPLKQKKKSKVMGLQKEKSKSNIKGLSAQLSTKSTTDEISNENKAPIVTADSVDTEASTPVTVDEIKKKKSKVMGLPKEKSKSNIKGLSAQLSTESTTDEISNENKAPIVTADTVDTEASTPVTVDEIKKKKSKVMGLQKEKSKSNVKGLPTQLSTESTTDEISDENKAPIVTAVIPTTEMDVDAKKKVKKKPKKSIKTEDNVDAIADHDDGDKKKARLKKSSDHSKKLKKRKSTKDVTKEPAVVVETKAEETVQSPETTTKTTNSVKEHFKATEPEEVKGEATQEEETELRKDKATETTVNEKATTTKDKTSVEIDEHVESKNGTLIPPVESDASTTGPEKLIQLEQTETTTLDTSKPILEKQKVAVTADEVNNDIPAAAPEMVAKPKVRKDVTVELDKTYTETSATQSTKIKETFNTEYSKDLDKEKPIDQSETIDLQPRMDMEPIQKKEISANLSDNGIIENMVSSVTLEEKLAVSEVKELEDDEAPVTTNTSESISAESMVSKTTEDDKKQIVPVTTNSETTMKQSEELPETSMETSGAETAINSKGMDAGAGELVKTSMETGTVQSTKTEDTPHPELFDGLVKVEPSGQSETAGVQLPRMDMESNQKAERSANLSDKSISENKTPSVVLEENLSATDVKQMDDNETPFTTNKTDSIATASEISMTAEDDSHVVPKSTKIVTTMKPNTMKEAGIASAETSLETSATDVTINSKAVDEDVVESVKTSTETSTIKSTKTEETPHPELAEELVKEEPAVQSEPVEDQPRLAMMEPSQMKETSVNLSNKCISENKASSVVLEEKLDALEGKQVEDDRVPVTTKITDFIAPDSEVGNTAAADVDEHIVSGTTKSETAMKPNAMEAVDIESVETSSEIRATDTAINSKAVDEDAVESVMKSTETSATESTKTEETPNPELAEELVKEKTVVQSETAEEQPRMDMESNQEEEISANLSHNGRKENKDSSVVIEEKLPAMEVKKMEHDKALVTVADDFIEAESEGGKTTEEEKNIVAESSKSETIMKPKAMEEAEESVQTSAETGTTEPSMKQKTTEDEAVDSAKTSAGGTTEKAMNREAMEEGATESAKTETSMTVSTISEMAPGLEPAEKSIKEEPTVELETAEEKPKTAVDPNQKVENMCPPVMLQEKSFVSDGKEKKDDIILDATDTTDTNAVEAEGNNAAEDDEHIFTEPTKAERSMEPKAMEVDTVESAEASAENSRTEYAKTKETFQSELAEKPVKEGLAVESKTAEQKPNMAPGQKQEASATLSDQSKMQNKATPVVLDEMPLALEKEEEHDKAPVKENPTDTSTTKPESDKTAVEDRYAVPESTKPEAVITAESQEPTPMERGDIPTEETKESASEPQPTEIVEVKTGQGDDDKNDNDVPTKSYIPADITTELELLRRELQVASKEKDELQLLLSEREDELKQCQDQIECLETEIEKQLDDWGHLADKLVEADTTIKSLMVEVQEVDGLKGKIDEYEKLKHELEEAKHKLSIISEKDGEAAVTEDGTSELEKKFNEKDEVISALPRELARHTRGDSALPTIVDFTSLNTSLARFSEEISMAMSELEEAQKKMA